MSTTCQIKFLHSWEIPSDSGTGIKIVSNIVYRHNDGFPDGNMGVLNSLKRFFKWNGDMNSNAEYTIANFIFWEKLNSIRERNKIIRSRSKGMDKKEARNTGYSIKTIKKILEDKNNPDNTLGLGICQEIKRDVDFFYNVQICTKSSVVDKIIVEAKYKPEGEAFKKIVYTDGKWTDVSA